MRWAIQGNGRERERKSRMWQWKWIYTWRAYTISHHIKLSLECVKRHRHQHSQHILVSKLRMDSAFLDTFEQSDRHHHQRNRVWLKWQQQTKLNKCDRHARMLTMHRNAFIHFKWAMKKYVRIWTRHAHTIARRIWTERKHYNWFATDTFFSCMNRVLVVVVVRSILLCNFREQKKMKAIVSDSDLSVVCFPVDAFR